MGKPCSEVSLPASVVEPARRRATTSGGSTSTARSMKDLFPAQTPTFTPLPCSPMARSWLAATSQRWEFQPASLHAVVLGVSTATGASTPSSIQERTWASTPWPCNRTERFWLPGPSRPWAAATRIGLGRLNPDGSPDSFNPGTSKTVGAPIVYTLALQTNGSIVVGGYFNGLGGGTGATGRNFIGRLTPDGSVDTFNPGANSISGINALALQADGKVVVGGSFTGLGGGTGTTPRSNIGRTERRRGGRHWLSIRARKLRS